MFLEPTTAWINLIDIMLSEINQKQKKLIHGHLKSGYLQMWWLSC